MFRRHASLPVLLAVALSSCTAAPAFAQAPEAPALALQPAPPEPAAAPGTVVLRIANATDCPMLLRVKQHGETVGVGFVKPHALQWGHFRAGGGVYEVELVVSPKLCGLVLPAPVQRDTEPASSSLTPAWQTWRTSLARPPGVGALSDHRIMRALSH